MLNRLTLFKKILLVGEIGIAIFAVYFAHSFIVGNETKVRIQAVAEQQIPIIESIDQSMISLYEIKELLASGMSAGESDLYDEALERAKSVRIRLSNITDLAEKTGLDASTLTREFDTYSDAALLLWKSIMSGNTDYEVSAKQAANMNSNYTKFEQTLMNLRTAAGTQLKTNIEQTQIAIDESRIIGVLLAIFGVVVLVSTSFYIAKTEVRAIKDVTKSLAEMSCGTADLTHRLTAKNKDEIGAMIHQFNRFLASMQHLITETKDAANSIENHSTTLQSIASETNADHVEQLQEITSVSNAISQLSSRSNDVLSSANSASNEVGEATRQTSSANTIVETNTSTIQALASEVAEATTVIDNLKDQTTEIGSVLDVIRGIAEQTNLLALNAAIEAARAGDQGRGFAVVADEVRNLAQRTQESTFQIDSMIERLQKGSKEAVSVMHESRKKAESSVAKSIEAENALSEIQRMVTSINDMNSHVAEAAKEQGTVSHEVDDNIQKIARVSETNVAQSDRTQNTSDALHATTEKLISLFGKFTV